MENPSNGQKENPQSQSQNQEFVERRGYKRVHTSEIVNCKKYGMTTLTEERKATGVMRNIGAGGLLIQTQTRFDIGDVLKLQIKLPGWQRFDYSFYKADALSYPQQFVALGTVVRSTSFSLGRYDVAICLTGVDPGHQWALQEYVKYKIKKLNP